jgi:hypothetical protein
MKLSALVFVVSSLAFGCATAQGATPALQVGPQRGTVLVEGAAAKAVVFGPAFIHAYAAFPGGVMYAVRSVSGTDADCASRPRPLAAVGLPADSVIAFAVRQGEVACLATSGTRAFELLWHTRPLPEAASPVLLARQM